MLELRPSCENCGKNLPNDSNDAMICTFECTFCHKCVDEILENVCPNCGGGFEKRPSRPKNMIVKYPLSQKRVEKKIDFESFESLQKKFKKIPPRAR